MIYTCTLNPAIDLFIQTDEMKKNIVNRTENYEIQANGKGVNVSFILKKKGVESTAIGVGGGFTNAYIESELARCNIKTDFVHIDANTRINVFTRVIQQDTEYKLVNKGPHVSADEINQFMDKIQNLDEKDTLVVSGSLSDGISEEILISIAKQAQKKGYKLVLDTSYQTVLDTLKYNPYILKPNDEELMSWFGVEHKLSQHELITYSKKLIKLGAQNILLSLGGGGAIFINKEVVLYGTVPKGTVVNTAGAGDTMLGTFLAGVAIGDKKIEEVFRESIAAASSTAFSKGLTDFSNVKELTKQVKISNIKEELR